MFHNDALFNMGGKMELYMTGRASKYFAVVLLLIISFTTSAEEMVAEFQGTGNRTTAEFVVDAPWILDWRINSDYNKMVSFDLDLVDAGTGMLQGVVVRSKALGNGVRMFNTSGRYRFRINGSFVRWHLKIKELTREEAELYSPRTPPR
jgi:hypothetical protein